MELIDRGYINENDTQIFYYDDLFKKLLEEDNSYKDLLQIIHYIIPRVKARDFKDEDGNPIQNKFGYFKNAIISNIQRLDIDIGELWDNEGIFDDLER